ncbi:hypothetical protein [Streptomyces sp. NPDC088707]|uniref:hypothetical protein n=1 Tax=Streptomyces sp. NPDC088707 TaxID=3365871 RepID=UPI00381B96D0
MFRPQPAPVPILTIQPMQPAKPTWWQAHRHQVLASAALVGGFVLGQHADNTPTASAPPRVRRRARPRRPRSCVRAGHGGEHCEHAARVIGIEGPVITEMIAAMAHLGKALAASVARLTWVLWVGSTIAMVWSATPEPGRTVATAITAVAGSALSLLALHSLSFTRDINVDVHIPTQPAPQVHAEIHLPRTEAQTPVYKPFDPQKPSQN